MPKVTFPFNAKDLQAALAYTDHSEGRYILGANQFWHGGIHLITSKDTQAILAPTDGEIIAHRTMKQRTEGPTRFTLDEKGNKASTKEEENDDISHGFVLTRHTYTTPEAQKINYYILHMHLLCYENYTKAHKNDPPPYLYKHQFFIHSDEDDGGSLIGKGLRLRSGPKNKNIINNVQTVLKKGQEIRFVKRGEYKHGEPPKGVNTYLEVEVLNPKTLHVPSGLITTGSDNNGQLNLLPVGFDEETIESVRYDAAHEERYHRFTVNTLQDNECGLALYASIDANRGKDPLIFLPFGYEIELLKPITLTELQKHALQPTKSFKYTQPQKGFVYCGKGYLNKQNTEKAVGKFDQVEILNPPLPIHSGEVIGYPGDYQHTNRVHMELWLEDIDFFDNPKGDKHLSDALTLPQGTAAKKSTAPTGQTFMLTLDERLYWVATLPNGVRKVRYGNPAQEYFVYHANLSDYKSSQDSHHFGHYSAKGADGRVILYSSNPEESEVERQEIVLGTSEGLHLVRPTLDNGIRKVIHGNPSQVYYVKRSEIGTFTPEGSYRPSSIDGNIVLYSSNPEEYTYTDSALPQFHIVESLPKTKVIDGKTYYIIEMSAEEESTEKTHFLVEDSEFDKHRLNYYDWKAFFLQKDSLESLGMKPSGYYPNAAEIRDSVLDELNEYIKANTMQQLPMYQSEHPLINLMVKAGSEWSQNHKDSVNWASDTIEFLWEKAQVTPEEEQGGITKSALQSCFNQTIKPFSDELSFYDELKAGIKGLPDKSAIWHAHPLKFLGHLEKLENQYPYKIVLIITRIQQWEKNPSGTNIDAMQGGTISKFELLINKKRELSGFMLEAAGPNSKKGGSDQRIYPGHYFLIKNPGTPRHPFRLVQKTKEDSLATLGGRSTINIHKAAKPSHIEGCFAPGKTWNTKGSGNSLYPRVNDTKSITPILKNLIINHSSTHKAIAYDGKYTHQSALFYEDVIVVINDDF